MNRRFATIHKDKINELLSKGWIYGEYFKKEIKYDYSLYNKETNSKRNVSKNKVDFYLNQGYQIISIVDENNRHVVKHIKE